jgi:MSHA biogenesis protein MshP
MMNGKNLQSGFTIVAAIFLLVILAALGSFMLSFSSAQQLTSAQDVQGARAYWAARAGLEWAAGKIIASSTCASPPSSMEGFTLVVNCTSETHDEGGVTRTVFRVTSTASTGASVGTPGYIERSLSAMLEI